MQRVDGVEQASEGVAGAPAPEAPSRHPADCVVRAPATGELHLLPVGAAPPRRLTSGADLLCSATKSAPAVRPYRGAWDERRACRTCLAISRGETPQAASTAPYLPTSAPTAPVGPRPSRLPAMHQAAPVSWKDWEDQPSLSHISPACEHCGDPGPGQWTHGHAQNPPVFLIAFRCPACGDERAYLRGRDGALALAWQQSGY